MTKKNIEVSKRLLEVAYVIGGELAHPLAKVDGTLAFCTALKDQIPGRHVTRAFLANALVEQAVA